MLKITPGRNRDSNVRRRIRSATRCRMAQRSSIPRQLPASPMMVPSIRIKLANVAAVQRPHDADARKHRRSARRRDQDQGFHRKEMAPARGNTLRPLGLCVSRDGGLKTHSPRIQHNRPPVPHKSCCRAIKTRATKRSIAFSVAETRPSMEFSRYFLGGNNDQVHIVSCHRRPCAFGFIGRSSQVETEGSDGQLGSGANLGPRAK